MAEGRDAATATVINELKALYKEKLLPLEKSFQCVQSPGQYMLHPHSRARVFRRTHPPRGAIETSTNTVAPTDTPPCTPYRTHIDGPRESAPPLDHPWARRATLSPETLFTPPPPGVTHTHVRHAPPHPYLHPTAPTPTRAHPRAHTQNKRPHAHQ